MGDLETYLEQHANTGTSKVIHIGENLQHVEDFCSENLDLFNIAKPAYRNLIIRGEYEQNFGRVSFAGTEPNLTLLRVVLGKSYQKDTKTYRTALTNAAEYLSLRFSRVVKATLITYKCDNVLYWIGYRTWVFNGRERLEPREQDYREMHLVLKDRKLIRDRTRDLKARLGHRH